jgi:hypothetical protein
LSTSLFSSCSIDYWGSIKVRIKKEYFILFLLCIYSFSGFMMSGGYVVNVGDFSGVHSGVVFGICNTICKKIFDHLINKMTVYF